MAVSEVDKPGPERHLIRRPDDLLLDALMIAAAVWCHRHAILITTC